MSAFCPEGCPDADACVVGQPCARHPKVLHVSTLPDAVGLEAEHAALFEDPGLTVRSARVIPRHLIPHTTFGDDPSGHCGCADCEPRPDICACEACRTPPE
jgi:hypothetical protein